MTPAQYKAYTEACNRFGDELAKIFGTGISALESPESMRDWEIISYMTTDTHSNPGAIVSHKGMGPAWRYHYECALAAGNVSIHSVRRLSDNTVWTTGDKVANDTGGHGNITAFHISANNRIRVDADCFLLSRDLEQLRMPEKKPLFTTADGVPLYDREQLVYDLSISGSNYTGRIFEGYAWQIFDWNHAYSTREAAEKAFDTWIESQPVLSFKDVSEWDNSPDGWDKLREIVKQKIANR